MWKNEADPFTCFMKAAADMCKDGFVRDVLSNHVQVKEDALKLQEIFRSSKAKFNYSLASASQNLSFSLKKKIKINEKNRNKIMDNRGKKAKPIIRHKILNFSAYTHSIVCFRNQC